MGCLSSKQDKNEDGLKKSFGSIDNYNKLCNEINKSWSSFTLYGVKMMDVVSIMYTKMETKPEIYNLFKSRSTNFETHKQKFSYMMSKILSLTRESYGSTSLQIEYIAHFQRFVRRVTRRDIAKKSV